MLDRIIANRHAEHCIVAIGLLATWVEFTEFTDASSKVAGMRHEAVTIGCNHIKPTRLSNTPYKLLQFELSGPGMVCVFVSVCLFLLSFV